MTLPVLMFYLLSAIILVFSVLTITTRRILRAAVYLLFVLVATSGFYFMLQYQFMAAVQLTLYAGGIVVLIIFSILLTSHISQKFEKPARLNLLMGVGVAIAGIASVLYVILPHNFIGNGAQELDVNMKVIGTQLLDTGKNGYVLPFELISILLLAAMVVAIVIAKKGKQEKS